MLRRVSSFSKTSALFALIAVQLVLLGVAIHFTSAPRIVSSFDGATVEIAADRSWTILPGECATVRWDLEGIQSVYVNGAGKVGRDEMAFCPSPNVTSLSFKITAGNGETRHFLLDIQNLSASTLSWLTMLALLLPLFAAFFYLLRMRLTEPIGMGSAAVLALAALLLLGLLIQTARPRIIADALDGLRAVFTSQSWHLFGSVLAGAVFVPLGIQEFRRSMISRMRADLIVVGAFLAAILLLFSTAGFDSIGQWETWPLQAYFEGRPSKAEAELISRFWLLAPHALASAISPDSFTGYHVVHLCMFWGMMAFFYGILRQLSVAPWLAFLAAVLFLAYPVNSSLMSLRSIVMTFSKLSLLVAIYLILDSRANVSRLRLLGVWLALLFNLGTYEISFVIIAIIPILWQRDSRQLWRNVNLTIIWYLVPVMKVAHLLLLNLNDTSYYGGWHFAAAPAGGSFTLDTVRYYFDIIAHAYLRTFVYGWQEALDGIGQNDWMAPTLATLGLIGIVAVYLTRGIRPEDFPSRREAFMAFLSGTLFVLPSIGVTMWVARRAFGLWRMYVYAPIGGAIAMLALVALLASPLKIIPFRKAFIIALSLILIFAGLSRLYVQQGWFVDSANAKARILMQIVEQAPYFDAGARLMIVTGMSSVELRAGGIKELHSNMFDSAMYMLYQEGRPSVAFLCMFDENCGSSDIAVESDFLDSASDFRDVVMFYLHDDLRVELLLELPAELSDRDNSKYDPLRLIDTAAPIPPRALSMLASAGRN